MKKVFSLILAVVMVASLASVAFAAQVDINEYIISAKAKDVAGATGYDSELKYLSSKAFYDAGNNLIFGKEYYYPIIANETVAATPNTIFDKVSYAIYAKQIGTLKVTADWKEGGEYVESVGIKTVYVTKDTNGNVINRNVYVIYVKTTGTSSDEENIVGTITVAGTAGSGASKGEKVETKISFDATIGKESADCATTSTLTKKTDAGTQYTYDSTKGTLEFAALTKTMKDVKFDLAKVGTVKFDGDVTATLDSPVAKKLTISYNTNDVASVVAANPDAAVMFYAIECNFKESAEVTIEPIDPEGANYLYQILNSGATKDLTSFYSVDDEQFVLNQRKLTGTYIVSDMPLVF